jgi:hypothetical protein
MGGAGGATFLLWKGFRWVRASALRPFRLPLPITFFNAPPQDRLPASSTSAIIAELRQPPYDQHVTADTPGELLLVPAGSENQSVVDFGVEVNRERYASAHLKIVHARPVDVRLGYRWVVN